MTEENTVPTMPGPFSQPQGLRPTNETPRDQSLAIQRGDISAYETVLAARGVPRAIRIEDLDAAIKLAGRLEAARKLHARITTGEPGFAVRLMVFIPAPSGRHEQADTSIDLADLAEPVAAHVVSLLLARLEGLGVVP